MSNSISIITPIHKVPEPEVADRLIDWVMHLPEHVSVIFCVDNSFMGSQVSEWVSSQFHLPSVKIIEGRYGNPGSARNAGLDYLKGTKEGWILFVDYDDFLFVTEAIKAISRKKVGSDPDILICQYETVDDRDTKVKLRIKTRTTFQLVLRLGFWRVIYRTEFLSDVRFPKLRMAEDQVFFSRVMAKNPRVDFRTEILYQYRVGRDSQLTSDAKNNNDLHLAVKIMRNELFLNRHQLAFRLLIFMKQWISFAKFKIGKREKSIRYTH